MEFSQPFKKATLVKRYKRFLADIELPNGEVKTIHCPNTGSMKNCNEPGSRIWYSTSENTKRKYPETWEIFQNAKQHLIGINTHRANALVIEAIHNGTIAELQGYDTLKAEVKYGLNNSRIDILLQSADNNCYVEVKNTTLALENAAYFPDAVTQRGQKHLQELAHVVSEGHRGVLLFCVQHTGVDVVKVADFIDSEYARMLAEVVEKGVEILCYQASISEHEICLTKKIPFAH